MIALNRGITHPFGLRLSGELLSEDGLLVVRSTAEVGVIRMRLFVMVTSSVKEVV